jgi:isoquinoline 1-oxidoreductase beta subunit
LFLGFGLEDDLAVSGTRQSLKPNAWFEVTPDDQVRIFVAKLEMGQGVRTALPMIVADELDADWERVTVVQATVDDPYKPYITGGSWSVAGSWNRLRMAGATGRAMLLSAAAQLWQVEPSTCFTRKGTVVHKPTGRLATYGSLSSRAAGLPIPEKADLKKPGQFTIIGRSKPRHDTKAICSGTAMFGTDVKLPGMLYASIERCPVIGGTVEAVDDKAALNTNGVRHVLRLNGSGPPHHLRSGIAVVADHTWAALKGRQSLEIHWNEGANREWGSTRIDEKMLAWLSEPGYVSRQDGSPEQAFTNSKTHLEATYKTPFLAHAPMEPMTAVANVQDDRVEMWVACQEGSALRSEVSRRTGIPLENVIIHMPLAGGAFGRRGKLDYALEALEISRQVKKPVQLLWTREDDMKHGAFRAASVHRLRAGFDTQGNPTALLYKVVTPSVVFFENPEAIKDGYDENIVIGANNLPYNIPAVQVESRIAPLPIPVRWWRGVYHSHSIFATEVFIDEMAVAAKKDPYLFRLKLLEGTPLRTFKHTANASIKVNLQRLRKVLVLAAERSGWNTPLPTGRGRGIACHFYDSECYIAQVVEVDATAEGSIKVTRVVSAVDCGVVVNPGIAKAQIEGGVIFALSSVFNAQITYENGRVVQSNFSDFPVFRMSQTPRMEVHFVSSQEAPGGIGEPGVPGVFAAVSNAIYSATGKRFRELPIQSA